MYDAIIVLGSRPDTQQWEFPSHVHKSLDVAADLFSKKAAPYIIVSGKWALWLERAHLQQPYRECDKLADYLQQKGVPPEAILKEGESKDTIANIYYTKRTILQPRGLKRLLIVGAAFRKERLAFICQKVLGPDYTVDFKIVPGTAGGAYPHESETFARTKTFLHDMPAGHDAFLKNVFYGAEFYTQPYS